MTDADSVLYWRNEVDQAGKMYRCHKDMQLPVASTGWVAMTLEPAQLSADTRVVVKLAPSVDPVQPDSAPGKDVIVGWDLTDVEASFFP
jgi:hypothetical protein